MTSANDLREALARVVTDQRRDADLVVNDIIAVLREYGREGWLIEHSDGSWAAYHDQSPYSPPWRVVVLTVPDKEPTDA